MLAEEQCSSSKIQQRHVQHQAQARRHQDLRTLELTILQRIRTPTCLFGKIQSQLTTCCHNSQFVLPRFRQTTTTLTCRFGKLQKYSHKSHSQFVLPRFRQTITTLTCRFGRLQKYSLRLRNPAIQYRSIILRQQIISQQNQLILLFHPNPRCQLMLIRLLSQPSQTQYCHTNLKF